MYYLFFLNHKKKILEHIIELDKNPDQKVTEGSSISYWDHDLKREIMAIR